MEKVIIILAALVTVSEALSLIPKVKANGVFQAIKNGIEKVLDLLKKK
jgi:hypothetical protein